MGLHCLPRTVPPNTPDYYMYSTVKILKIRTPEKTAVITLKFEQHGFTIEYCVQKMLREWQTV